MPHILRKVPWQHERGGVEARSIKVTLQSCCGMRGKTCVLALPRLRHGGQSTAPFVRTCKVCATDAICTRKDISKIHTPKLSQVSRRQNPFSSSEDYVKVIKLDKVLTSYHQYSVFLSQKS